eukprot:jgi/Bigna1/72424/fgenesh1_pg.19_\
MRCDQCEFKEKHLFAPPGCPSLTSSSSSLSSSFSSLRQMSSSSSPGRPIKDNDDDDDEDEDSEKYLQFQILEEAVRKVDKFAVDKQIRFIVDEHRLTTNDLVDLMEAARSLHLWNSVESLYSMGDKMNPQMRMSHLKSLIQKAKTTLTKDDAIRCYKYYETMIKDGEEMDEYGVKELITTLLKAKEGTKAVYVYMKHMSGDGRAVELLGFEVLRDLLRASNKDRRSPSPHPPIPSQDGYYQKDYLEAILHDIKSTGNQEEYLLSCLQIGEYSEIINLIEDNDDTSTEEVLFWAGKLAAYVTDKMNLKMYPPKHNAEALSKVIQLPQILRTQRKITPNSFILKCAFKAAILVDNSIVDVKRAFEDFRQNGNLSEIELRHYIYFCKRKDVPLDYDEIKKMQQSAQISPDKLMWKAFIEISSTAEEAQHEFDKAIENDRVELEVMFPGAKALLAGSLMRKLGDLGNFKAAVDLYTEVSAMQGWGHKAEAADRLTHQKKNDEKDKDDDGKRTRTSLFPRHHHPLSLSFTREELQLELRYLQVLGHQMDKNRNQEIATMIRKYAGKFSFLASQQGEKHLVDDIASKLMRLLLEIGEKFENINQIWRQVETTDPNSLNITDCAMELLRQIAMMHDNKKAEIGLLRGPRPRERVVFVMMLQTYKSLGEKEKISEIYSLLRQCGIYLDTEMLKAFIDVSFSLWTAELMREVCEDTVADASSPLSSSYVPLLPRDDPITLLKALYIFVHENCVPDEEVVLAMLNALFAENNSDSISLSLSTLYEESVLRFVREVKEGREFLQKDEDVDDDNVHVEEETFQSNAKTFVMLMELLSSLSSSSSSSSSTVDSDVEEDMKRVTTTALSLALWASALAKSEEGRGEEEKDELHLKNNTNLQAAKEKCAMACDKLLLLDQGGEQDPLISSAVMRAIKDTKSYEQYLKMVSKPEDNQDDMEEFNKLLAIFEEGKFWLIENQLMLLVTNETSAEEWRKKFCLFKYEFLIIDIQNSLSSWAKLAEHLKQRTEHEGHDNIKTNSILLRRATLDFDAILEPLLIDQKAISTKKQINDFANIVVRMQMKDDAKFMKSWNVLTYLRITRQIRIKFKPGGPFHDKRLAYLHEQYIDLEMLLIRKAKESGEDRRLLLLKKDSLFFLMLDKMQNCMDQKLHHRAMMSAISLDLEIDHQILSPSSKHANMFLNVVRRLERTVFAKIGKAKDTRGEKRRLVEQVSAEMKRVFASFSYFSYDKRLSTKDFLKGLSNKSKRGFGDAILKIESSLMKLIPSESMRHSEKHTFKASTVFRKQALLFSMLKSIKLQIVPVLSDIRGEDMIIRLISTFPNFNIVWYYILEPLIRQVDEKENATSSDDHVESGRISGALRILYFAAAQHDSRMLSLPPFEGYQYTHYPDGSELLMTDRRKNTLSLFAVPFLLQREVALCSPPPQARPNNNNNNNHHHHIADEEESGNYIWRTADVIESVRGGETERGEGQPTTPNIILYRVALKIRDMVANCNVSP